MRLVAQGLRGTVASGASAAGAPAPGATPLGAAAGETPADPASDAAPAGPTPAGATPAGPTPAEVVRRMVAMQGQDLAQVLRAIAIRSAPGTTIAQVRAAFDRGEIVRSWPMRGTLFAIAPDDLAVLLAWTAERIRRASAPQRRERGLDDATIDRARDIAVAAVAEAPRTRAALLEVWEAAGIETGRGRGYMLISQLAMERRMHWGPFAGTQQTLVPSAPIAVDDPEAGLAGIARRYVAARGPVTTDDFAWWTGLTKTDARAAVARAGGLVEVLVEGVPMWIASEQEAAGRSGVLLVPGFDEWVLGYRDRALIASAAMREALVPGSNGVFKPAVLVDGRAVGTWRWPPQPGRRPVEPELALVERVSPTVRARIERALEAWPHR